MLTHHTTMPSDEARRFLQDRVALVGKVLLVVCCLGVLAQALAWPTDGVRRPGFLLLVAGTVFPALQWLACRGPLLSKTAIRALELGGMLGTAVCASLAGGSWRPR